MDRLRSIVILLLALAQIIVPFLLFPRGFEIDVGSTMQGSTPIVPAEYAFSIWGPIFLGSLALAVVGVLPGYVSHPLLRRIGWLVAATFAASTLWMVVARFGPNWLTLPLILIGFATMGTAFVWASRWPTRGDWVLTGLVVVPLGLYAGWLSIAVFANLSEVLAAAGVAWFVADLGVWTIILLVLATFVALEGILLSGGSLAYAAAVTWGLVAIIAANSGTTIAWVAAGAVVAVLVTLLARVVARLQMD